MFSTPRLSSIDPDSVAIGRTAARTLADMLADSRIAADPQNLTVPPKGIVKRTSTDTYPDAPPWFAEAMFFIRANVTKNISASGVFRHVGYSRTLVERAFRRHISSSVQRKSQAFQASPRLNISRTSSPRRPGCRPSPGADKTARSRPTCRGRAPYTLP